MPTTVTALAANVGLEVTGLSGPDLVNRSSASAVDRAIFMTSPYVSDERVRLWLWLVRGAGAG